VVALPVALVAGLLTYRTLSGMRPTAQATSSGPANTAPVSMPAPTLTGTDATTCQAFIANLPGRASGLQRRPVTAGLEQNAAYGDPPITISCANGPGPAVPPDGMIFPISGVCWYQDDTQPNATAWRTLDRQVVITVSFPAAYRNQGEGDMLQAFRDAILARVPSLPDPPSYCGAPSIAPS
jgi:hypothetical protein